MTTPPHRPTILHLLLLLLAIPSCAVQVVEFAEMIRALRDPTADLDGDGHADGEQAKWIHNAGAYACMES